MVRSECTSTNPPTHLLRDINFMTHTCSPSSLATAATAAVLPEPTGPESQAAPPLAPPSSSPESSPSWEPCSHPKISCGQPGEHLCR